MHSVFNADASVQLRKYRMTVRARFALIYCALLTGAGAVMLAMVYVFMRFVPTYDFPLTDSSPAALAPSGLLSEAPAPLPSLSGDQSTPAIITEPASAIVVSSTDQFFNLLLLVSAVVLVILAVIGIGVGWAAAGRMLRPLQHINEAVNQATRGDLSHRIALAGPQDEISDLANNFDAMLAQLQASMDASKRFAANSSHELRTPLATTRALIDLALVQTTDPKEAQVFDRLRQTNERSIQTVEALLELSQIEAKVGDLVSVDLEETLQEAIDLCAPEAAEHGVTVQADLQAHGQHVLGQPVLLRQLCTNLIQNAIRHNLDHDGTILIRTSVLDDNDNRGKPQRVRLEVENSGEQLEEARVASLTEPFIRSGGRTTAKAKGHGLGLSIVAAIVRRVEGKLTLTPRPAGGLLVQVEFQRIQQ